MAEIWSTESLAERVILVGVQVTFGRQPIAMADSLDELAELVKTAGAETVGRVMQQAEGIHPATYVGSGKVEEIRQMVWALDATGIVCDDELSPAQLNNLEQMLECKVMDRTLVILDIFAGRATSSEGKLQVELAQLRYRAARLVGMRNSLSRLGGGIGTRGPGEKKLETDRRLIKSRISHLKGELEEVKRHRDLLRSQRKENHMPTAAIVGYTNAGKSTLLNRLTGANVLEEDKLFATLDPTTRVLELPGKQQVLLTDTVGFIYKLPHHLIEAFRSTLEEACYADYIIHVADISNPMLDMQMQVVYDTLRSLGANEKKVLTLFNKCDRIEEPEHVRDLKAWRCLYISALTGQGLEEFRESIGRMVNEDYMLLERVFPYTEGSLLQIIRKNGRLFEEEYLADGVRVKASVPKELYGKLC
ncbi:MAG TPA: GTPase HflX [Lachnospiraceae bacterium]|nr:GTPase HflX [Lachnospiraceae bacterium]